MWATVGILAALRQRDSTGLGQWIDISLLDGQVAWLSYVASGFFASGEVPRRYGSAHPTIVPYQAFPTSDGHMMIAAGNDGLWVRLAEALGLAHLAHDPRFATNPDRVRRRAELIPLLEEALATRTAAEWSTLLSAAGIPAGRINTVDQALAHPQVMAREMVVEMEHETARTVRAVASPIRMSGSPTRKPTAPPLHGQHTAEILAALGIDEQARAAEPAPPVTR
jgi:formyl-CoA transferase/CoA:oxalate CoA-transferase